jgi:hypothetical protein
MHNKIEPMSMTRIIITLIVGGVVFWLFLSILINFLVSAVSSIV